MLDVLGSPLIWRAGLPPDRPDSPLLKRKAVPVKSLIR
jgi:hypothetical protein